MLDVLILAASALAAPASNASCASASSTVEIVACLQAETRRFDARLNEAYRGARSRSSPGEAAAIQRAQRAWVAYRDANCRAYASGEGTIARIEAATCARDMTRTRAGELARWNASR